MTNSPFFADATTIASVEAVMALLNNGYLEIYNGLQPTDANTAVGSQTLLSGGMRFNGTGWNTFGYGRSNTFAYTALSLSVTGGTVTLTSTQAANTIQVYGGTLTSNVTIIVPPTVQLYAITNSTSGSFTFTVKTAAGTGVTIPQGTSLTVTCDGTNVYNASSGTSSSITSTTFAAGSAPNPSINFTGSTTTGLYLPSSNTLGISVNGAQAATFSATGLYVANGISGGSF